MRPGKLPEEFKHIPFRNKGDCFGCGTGNAMGLKMEFYSDGNSVVTQLAVPEHLCGWQNVVHGGIIATILDEAMGWAAMFLMKRLVLTKSMNVEFLQPVMVNQQLIVKGQVDKELDERQARIQGELYNTTGELCAKSEGIFALFTLEAARNLDFLDTALLDEIEQQFLSSPR